MALRERFGGEHRDERSLSRRPLAIPRHARVVSFSRGRCPATRPQGDLIRSTGPVLSWMLVSLIFICDPVAGVISRRPKGPRTMFDLLMPPSSAKPAFSDRL